MKENKPQKILIAMYSMGTGGAELQFLELAIYLKKQNYIVKVIGLGPVGNLVQDFIKNNIDVEVIGYKKNIFSFLRAIFLFVMQARKYNIIISTSFVANLATLIASFFGNSIIKIAFQTVSNFMSRFPALEGIILNRFKYIIAGANDIQEYLITHKIKKHRIKVIHNWVDFSTKKITLSKEETRIKYNLGEDMLIGCIARLHEQKGQIYLLKSIDAITSPTNFKVVIVGDGPEYTSLLNYVKDNFLENRVVFLGEIRGDDYNNLMNTFDIFILPSLYEGLPRTLLDAMYFEKPIIATNVNGNSEAIHNEINGLLVPAQDSSAISNAISQLLIDNDKQLHFSLVAKSNVMQYFDINKQLEKVEYLLCGKNE